MRVEGKRLGTRRQIATSLHVFQIFVAETGNGVVKKAMVELRSKFREILNLTEEDDWTVVGDRVVLVMTTEGLRVVELATGDVMHFTYIRDISFSTHLHSGYDRKHVRFDQGTISADEHTI